MSSIQRSLMVGRVTSAVIMAMVFSGLSVATKAQDVVAAPTRGTQFWTGFMQNGFGAQSLKVHIMTTTPVTGTVSMPLTGWSDTFTVGANAVAIIDVPLAAENTGSGTIQAKGVRIETSDSVNVHITSSQNYTIDASQILPDHSLGNSYRVDAYSGLAQSSNLHKSELLVVATEDGTQVRITPSVNTQSGQLAGVPFLVDLNAGQTYQLHAATDVLDLTGTLIESTEISGTCRPFAVFGGAVCAGVPGACQACDMVFEQLLPRNTWGTRYFTVPVNGVTSMTYRILADEDNTSVTIGAAAPFILNAGQRHEVNGTSTPVCIQSNKPISVAQMLEGYACAGNGDPSLLLVSPIERVSYRASFHTPSSAQLNQHSISVVMPAGATNQLLLDGNPVSSALFQPYAGCTDRLHARIPVGQGVHRLQSTVGFQAYMFGLGYGESYAASVNSIGGVSEPQDSVICGGGPVTLNAPVPLDNAEWTAASAPTVVLGTGNSIFIVPTASESYTVSGQLPISGCDRTFTFHVGVPLTIPTLLTANDEPSVNICQYEPVQLALVPPPDPGWFDVQWTPSNSLNNATIANPVASPTTSTWYKVSVTSPSGCGDLLDSVLVTVQLGAILDLETNAQPATICAGGSTQLTSSVLRVIGHEAFDSGPGSMWTAVQGGAPSAACGSVSGQALYFNGSGQRYAQTIAFNTSGGGEVRFHLKIAQESAPCDNADPGEDVVLEYSTNNGLNWSLITTYGENDHPAFTPITASIPLAAQGTSVMFRLRQLSSSGAGQDNWAFDEFLVARFDDAYASYAWSPASTIASPQASASAATPAGTVWYTLHVTDPLAGCVYSDSSLVQVDPAFSLTVTPNTTLCSVNGTQLSAAPSSGSGITYTWSPNDGTLSDPGSSDPMATPVATTTYTVNATNASGCTASGQVTITVGQLFGLTVSASDTILCQGQITQLNASVSGGSDLSYVWTGAGLNSTTTSDPIATPAQTTTYTCTVSHIPSGCSLTQSMTIVVNTGYTANAGTDADLCSALGHQLTVQHNVPGPTYSWSPAGNLNSATIQSPTILADVSATYTVIVTDANGCSVSDQVTITRAFENLPTTQSAVACANAPPLLTAPAVGTSYQWSTGASTSSITPTTSGPHTVSITNAQGCVGVSTFNVTLHALPVVDLGPDLMLCAATEHQLNAGNAGSAYLWSTGATGQSITVNSSGTYSVTVTNGNGCSASDAVSIALNPPPIDVLQDVTICQSGTALLDAGNVGSTYVWNNGATSQTISPTVAGNYSVVVTSPQQCTATFTAQVTILPDVSVSLGNDTLLCAGSSVVLDAGSPGLSYIWSTGATTQTITASAQGTYQVAVSNGVCDATDAMTITLVAAPTNNLQNITQCADQPATLDAGNPGSNYLWSTGATTPTIVATSSGTYNVLITGASGCSATYQSIVSLIQPPVVALGPDTVLCEGEVLYVDAGIQANTSYLWNTGATTPTLAITQPNTYTVLLNNGCQRRDSITVFFNPSPARMAVREFHTCLDDEPRYVVLDAGNTGSQYAWSTGSSSQVIMASAYGVYYVHITNTHDCAVRDSAEVIEFCPATIYVPNTFTPNGDGLNDIFIPVGKSIASIHLMVFDRWGEPLFETLDQDIGWDGTYRGEPVKNDMYVWRMTYKFYTDEDGTLGMEQRQMGHIQVLR